MRKNGRNDPCACGSGKKHKHCCLGNGASPAPPLHPEETSIPAALRSAIEHHRHGRLEQAEAIYRAILDVTPNHAEALHLSGVIFNQRGDNRSAVAFINRAIAANPAEAAYYSNLGNALKALGQGEDAVASYRKALSITPDFPDALNNMGVALKELARTEEAIASFRQALAVKPDFPEAHNNLGLALGQLGQQDAAVASYRKALSLKPAAPEIHINLGNTLKELGRLLEAADCYRHALTIQPGNAEARNNLGLALEEQGKPDEAIAAYNQALAIRPDFAEARNNLGNALEKQGMLDHAAACFSNALAIKPDFTEPYLNLSSMLISLGKVAEAATLLELGLSNVDKGNWRVASLASIATWILGRHGEARALVDHYLAAAFSEVSTRHNLRQRIFLAYVAKLLDRRHARPDLYTTEPAAVPLAVLGDSHCLSPANMAFAWRGVRVVASSHLIPGIKMFHLGASAKKQFPMYLAAHLRSIDPASHLLFTIGEIDCRPNEGIWKAHLKKERSLPDIIASCVDDYLGCIASQISGLNFASITLQGIPAPAYALSGDFDPGDRPGFVAMVGAVNEHLRHGSLSRGWHFLDIHAATAGSDGSNNEKWNLDGFHLLPEFYVEAMRWVHEGNSRHRADLSDKAGEPA